MFRSRKRSHDEGLCEGNKKPAESQRPRGENFKEEGMVGDVECSGRLKMRLEMMMPLDLETWRSLATFRKNIPVAGERSSSERFGREEGA